MNNHSIKDIFLVAALSMFSILSLCAQIQAQSYQVDALQIEGGADSDRGRIAITATISDPDREEREEKRIYTTNAVAYLTIKREEAVQRSFISVSPKSGIMQELEFNILGDFEVVAVLGDNVAHWAVRRDGLPTDGSANKDTEGTARLVVMLKQALETDAMSADKDVIKIQVNSAKKGLKIGNEIRPNFYVPEDRQMLTGSILIDSEGEVFGEHISSTWLTQTRFDDPYTLSYNYADNVPNLTLKLATKPRPDVSFKNFSMVGDYQDGRFSFTLSGQAEVINPGEFELTLLSGAAALSKAPQLDGAAVRFAGDRYYARFDQPGIYPVRLFFDAKVATAEGRSSVRFNVMDSAVQPVSLTGLPADGSHIRLNGLPLERADGALKGSLSGDGLFRLLWTDPSWQSREPGDAALFYSAESVSRLEVGPGLLRQESSYAIRIMQGSMRRLVFDLEGVGEITQVEGDSVLRWEVCAGKTEGSRQLVLELNKAYQDDFELQVRSQDALAAFPARAEPLRVLPVDAIRYNGYLRITNQGAVSIDVPELAGLAQISPEYFPGPSEVLSADAQVLAYRFSDVNYRYTILAEDILPEVSVSQILLYRVGAEDQSLRGELELTIRKAPLRDFYIQVPAGYSLSKLQAPQMADYFLLDGESVRQLRIVFVRPLTGRHTIEVAFENNRVIEGEAWELPVFRPVDVKNLRGHVGVTVEPGLRVKVSALDGVAEQAVNFFPQAIDALQLALRVREPDWSATLTVEQLPQAVQADLLRLFSVGEGRIYGSTVANFLISGAPVSEFRIQVPQDAENVDFVGRDIRGWTQDADGVYEVRLHAPAAAAYTLLCTYESKLDPQSGKVRFQGVNPIGVASEQGYLVVVSNFPFSIGALDYASDLIRLEPNEIPAEFRLLFDAQVLAAFQYTNSPSVGMELRSPKQAEARNQVIDFANLKSHISCDGEVLTQVELMLKSKGQTHFRMQLPPNHRIWSARVEGRKVNPISTEAGILLPLPAGHDPASALQVTMELAAESGDPQQPVVYAPALHAPALTVNWELTSDPGYGLRYLDGAISSDQMSGRDSGFAWLRAVLAGTQAPMRLLFIAMLGMGVLALVLAKTLIQKFEQFGRYPRVFMILGVLALLSGVTFCGIILGAIPVSQEALRECITLKAPIELSSQPLRLQLANLPLGSGMSGAVFFLPLLLGLGLWGYGYIAGRRRNLCWALGWIAIFIGALSSNGGAFFIITMMLFFLLNLLRPLKDQLLQRGHVAAIAAVLFAVMVFPVNDAEAKSLPPVPAAAPALADSIRQQIVVNETHARVEASLQWRAAAGERCRFLRAPAALLDGSALPAGLRLLQLREGGQLVYELEAVHAGDYRYDFAYRVTIERSPTGGANLLLPVGQALSHRARITIPNVNVVLESEQAVSIQPAAEQPKVAIFEVVFQPADVTTVTWSPERRDASKEKPVYYVESHDLYAPLAGLVSGSHVFNVRLAQGQLDALQLQVPEDMTITAVDAHKLANWHFDPAAHALMLYFDPVQQEPFTVAVSSQVATGSLPYPCTVRPLAVEGAASQLSLLGLATDAEVQIGEVSPTEAVPINLEDFPADQVKALAYLGSVPQLRRAYRWDVAAGSLDLQALAVQPDIRSTTKQTVSLGEDRILIALELQAEINRTGVFKLSLPLREGYDVESVTGEHLSHWNQITGRTGERTLQLHLNGKTMGTAVFNLSLSGPGLAGRSSYQPPVLQLAETDRQVGTLILVPELGYRLQTRERDAAVQLDPSQSGIQQKNILLFRILNQTARLAFDVERVDPWIELERVESVGVRSGVVEVRARFSFTVENAGVREQRIVVPDAALGVQFTGEPLADARETAPGQWLVSLKRKMVGKYSLNLAYQIPTPDQPDRIELQGIEVPGANQQSGYLALVPHGRIQLVPQGTPEALQPAEAHMIDSKLRGDLVVDQASHVYRIMESGFRLALGVKRHEIADLVPAQVRDVHLASIISGAGSVLTKVTLQLDPGDKRMLRITLPPESEFWFGSINQQSVWPWKEDGDVLLQLESSALAGKDSVVEFFYATQLELKPGRTVHTRLVGPSLDLPLENIAWTLYYPETWRIDEWDGNLTIDTQYQAGSSVSNMSDYMQLERETRLMKKSRAESLLTEANVLLEQGKQEQARSAFSSAYNLSQSDDALNEDARVQFQNVRQQQVLVAIANRRNAFINDKAGSRVTTQQMEVAQENLLNFTERDLQGVLGGNTVEENDALRRLAARLIDQQQAVPVKPQAIETTLPQQGQTASFSRSLHINERAGLVIEIAGHRRHGGRAGASLGILVLLAALSFGVSALSGRKSLP